jgi:hypothetical protein
MKMLALGAASDAAGKASNNSLDEGEVLHLVVSVE